MDMEETFGVFLKSMRKERGITVRAMAELVDLSPGAYSDVESGRMKPPGRKTLDKMLEALHLLDDDREMFFDLAGQARSAAPPDLTSYINETKLARVALRVAKEKASEDDWRRFIKELEKKEE